jgi:hypothetical protein
METIIKVNSSELNKSLLDKIRKFIGNKENAEITISITSAKEHSRNETREQYFARLDKSIENLETGNVVSFTTDEFKSFSSKLLNQR